MADVVDEERPALELATPALEERRAPPAAEERSYRGRFLLVYALLALVLGGAVAGLVVLVGDPGAEPEQAWSAWEPEGGEPGAVAQQIAEHVGAQYRLPSGSQLVGVQATEPRVQDVPIGAIAIRRPPEAGAADGGVEILPSEGSVVYILCGFGENCSIPEGEPSPERLRLLRREGLELALYTFRYLAGTDSVVVFLPPAPGEDPVYALFFRRGELESEVARPIRLTLPDSPAPAADAIRPSEITTIERLTGPSLFRFQFTRLQDGTAVLVLDDPRLEPVEPSEPAGGGSEEPAAQ